jgi:hypothetical protein
MKTILYPLCLVALFLASACRTVTDISTDRRYVTDYSPGLVLKTKQLLFVRYGSLVETVPGSTPRSAEAYFQEKSIWNRLGVDGFLVPGTALRVQKLVRKQIPNIGEVFKVYAEVLDDGEAIKKGTVVDLGYISQPKQQTNPPARVPHIDPAVLEKVP